MSVRRRAAARGPFGTDEDGYAMYWPDASFLSVKIPAPMEQHLEFFGDALGMTAEEAAVFLIRNALMESPRLVGFLPDRARYLPKKGR